ncbi:MAG: DeoR/GlpR family DNA-binding transcription regulator [Lachnospiraceae bacterium]|nr:DeoR/GlpR family DNA-binding transcription regulator [Lachnospiraceae bacterium]
MLAEERWGAILDLVEKQKTVTVQELTDLLNTSESTVRRDLNQLDHMGKLNKVHGGATCIDPQYVLSDQTMTEKYELNSEEKEKIASYACQLIGPDDFVYIDAGTTTERLVDRIEETHALFVTNSIAHARKLLMKGCRVILPGGELKTATEALVGADTVEWLRRYQFTIGFWGTNGISVETGFTTPEVNEAMVKEMSMRHTKKRFVLADAEKFTRVSLVSFGEFDSAIILTNHVPDEHLLTYKNIVEVDKL